MLWIEKGLKQIKEFDVPEPQESNTQFEVCLFLKTTTYSCIT